MYGVDEAVNGGFWQGEIVRFLSLRPGKKAAQRGLPLATHVI